MKSSVKSGLLIGIVCAGIGGAGYYATNPDLAKSLFVSAVGLVIGAAIFIIMSLAGGRHDQAE